MNYQPKIGLEIHVELNTISKMFCSCSNDLNARHPNVHICPICTAQPGSLPVINKEAVKKTIKTGMALNCQIPECSKFDRKNYFYPDLPKGYQISQLYMPFCRNGYLEIEDSPAGKPGRRTGSLRGRQASYGIKKIRIREVHLEEDTGRLVHPEGADYSLVDFNRAGIPLMELVTEPDINSAKEAREFTEELQLILRYLGVSDADMEKGQLRVEVNISLLPLKSEILNPKSKTPNKFLRNYTGQANSKFKILNSKLGTKVEIKNLNSFRAVEKAIEYEIERQTKILNLGKKIIQETRGWDEKKGVTMSQREKEEAHDYRYFPEPDLPPLRHSKEFIAEIRAEIPEPPRQRRERFKKEYDLPENEIEVFVQNKKLGGYFEKIVSEVNQWVKEIEIKKKINREEFLKLTKLAANYLITDFQGLLKRDLADGQDFPITPENFAEFVALIYEGKISSRIAKMVLEEMFKSGADPSHIIEEKGLAQITDVAEIEKIIKEIISKNKKAVEDFKKGKANASQYLIGKIMAETRGKANPQIVKDILHRTLISTRH